ncbi:MAG: protein kinase [Myxococcales bacterium]|nr:protein kinase [Myxococcales bacterium]MCB9520958.1 protein kinase [Myxococcales bacterium]MCB9532629.1 protein kinase [Myxococcales bacterium]
MTVRVLAGRFALLEAIGRGGYGAVYRAVQLSVDRVVAIKVLHPSLADRFDVIARFEREARLTSRLSHPNAVRVIDFGTDGDELFLAMEFVAGETLKSRLANGERVGVDDALAIARGIADALAEAHALGLVHRDLKPANIILREDKSPPEPVVIDFGLVKVFDAAESSDGLDVDVTRSSVMIGTPAYMSPECVTGAPLDGQADVFSLGVVLYELLAGARPFVGRTATETVFARVDGHAAPLPAEIPREVAALVGAMLTRDPELRPDARAVVAWIDALATAVDAAPTPRDAGAALTVEPRRTALEAAPAELVESPRPPPVGTDVASPPGSAPVPWLSRPKPRLVVLAAALTLAAFGGAWGIGGRTVPTQVDADRPAVGSPSPLASSDPAAASLDSPPGRAPGRVEAAAPAQAQPDVEAGSAPFDDPLAPLREGGAKPRTPTPAAAAPVEAPAEPSQSDRSPARGSTTPSATDVTTATLSVNVEPYGSVYVDGSHIGTAPVVARPVRPGLHTVTSRYMDQEQSETVRVRAGGSASVTHRYQRQ